MVRWISDQLFSVNNTDIYFISKVPVSESFIWAVRNVARQSTWLTVCQRHIPRDRRPSTAACLACWAMGSNDLKMFMKGENCSVRSRLEQPRQDKNLLYRHDKPSNQPRMDTFHLYSSSPHFKTQPGPPLSSLSGQNLKECLLLKASCIAGPGLPAPPLPPPAQLQVQTR
jgi:hypothetical protein